MAHMRVCLGVGCGGCSEPWTVRLHTRSSSLLPEASNGESEERGVYGRAIEGL